MPFLDNFSQWKKLDTKNQRVNPTEIKFQTVNCKIRKKMTIHIFIYFINQRLTVALATKYRLK